MPRYFFNWLGSQERHDGMEFSGPEEARSVAVLAVTEILKDAAGEFLPFREYRLLVTDEAGVVVCELRVHGAQGRQD